MQGVGCVLYMDRGHMCTLPRLHLSYLRAEALEAHVGRVRLDGAGAHAADNGDRRGAHRCPPCRGVLRLHRHCVGCGGRHGGGCWNWMRMVWDAPLAARRERRRPTAPTLADESPSIQTAPGARTQACLWINGCAGRGIGKVNVCVAESVGPPA